MAGDLAKLKTFLERADEILATAEQSGMEVSSARFELTNARESLIKARVTVHTLDPEEVRKLTEQGVDISAKTYRAGVAALQERDLRRKGLGLSLIFIVLAITGLYLKIRRIESPTGS